MLSSTVIFSLIVISLSLSTKEHYLEKQKKRITNFPKTNSIHEPVRKIHREVCKKPQLARGVYVDGIAHFEINTRKGRKLKKFEELFKNALSMKGVNYIYKRDMFWRTWRDVVYSNGSKGTVFYKCSHIINTKCKHCFGGGFWKIDEDPIPCPYEILSMVNKKQICVVNYTQMNKINNPCPWMSSLVDLRFSCEDPMLTMYRFTNMFTNRKESDICQGRANCDISTFYRIHDNYIIFRIMNSSNDVIYSKIMRHDKRNFACNTDCGRFDPVNMKLIVLNHSQSLPPKKGAKGKKLTGRKKKKKTTASPCRKLQTTTADYNEDYDYPLNLGVE